MPPDDGRPDPHEPSAAAYDQRFWEERWSEALREHGPRIAQRPPNEYLTATVAELTPGRALDAGCGNGSEALWLATRGWRVTAVDFSATALANGRSTREALQVGAACGALNVVRHGLGTGGARAVDTLAERVNLRPWK